MTEAIGFEPNRRGVLAVIAAACLFLAAPAHAQDATALLRAAYDNWRADSSQSLMSMTIHRPTWERTMTMKTYTRGEDDALVRFTAPAKDAGNATLKVGNSTWVYNPKLNQTIKLPNSLLSQSWMGSDFSYSDLARSDDILEDFTHRLIGTDRVSGHAVHVIEAVPKRGAAVVWGKEVVKIRPDGIMMEVTYYDQDGAPVRTMRTDKVGRIGGRDYPVVMTMSQVASPNEWTRITTQEAVFNVALPDYLFTQSNLANPRD